MAFKMRGTPMQRNFPKAFKTEGAKRDKTNVVNKAFTAGLIGGSFGAGMSEGAAESTTNVVNKALKGFKNVMTSQTPILGNKQVRKLNKATLNKIKKEVDAVKGPKKLNKEANYLENRETYEYDPKKRLL